MSLQDLVNVTIDKQTASVSRVGFGTPLIMSTEAFIDSKFSETAKVYTSLAEMGSTGDNFNTSGVTYKKAQAIFAQNPKVDRIVVGKRALAPTMTINLTPIAVDSTPYTVTINGTDYTYTSDTTATVAEIIAGLVSLINGGTENVVASDQTTYMDIKSATAPGGSSVADTPFTISVSDRTIMKQENVTADPGVVTDLTTIRTSIDGNDDWYAVVLDSYGSAEITALAAHIETLSKIFLAITSDYDVLESGSGDIASTLQSLSYVRTILVWHEDPHASLEAGWAGDMLPRDPGSATWKFKTIVGVSYSVFTPAEQLQIQNKGCNIYIRLAGNNIMTEGISVGGEFVDVTRGIDFVTARIQENVFAQMINLPKIPFTDQGIGVVESEVRGVMNLSVSQGIFAANPEPLVTVPRASEVAANDKANRFLPDVYFSATLAGAVHSVEVNGVVVV